MTYDDFRSELEQSGLSGREFARLLRLNPNTIANYKQVGEVPRLLAVIAVLVRTLEQNGVEYRPQVDALGLRPTARRGTRICKSTA